MYKAKAVGKNTYAFFESELSAHAREAVFIEGGLRQALNEGHLEVHYQPQIALADMSLCGVEALLRWRHPEQGLISPERFIPIAEQSDLIIDLGCWVLRAACRGLRSLDTAGLFIPRVSVNLSPRQLQGGSIAEIVTRALDDNFLDPSRLEVEVTESALQHTESALEKLTMLAELGVTVAMDDFGTGYSCLGSLKFLPLHRLKIDQGFIRDLTENSSDSALVAVILSMGKSLGLDVVAEGVETEAQLEFLKRANCPHVQGFLLGRPMPLDELAAWLRSR